MSCLISACLLGIDCRYDGGNCRSEEALGLIDSVDLVPVCPEQLGGLPTPRPGADIHGGDGYDVLDGSARVVSDDGTDVTAEFINGARQVLKIARLYGASTALLKQRSPSCGCGQICRGTDVVPGDGVTAALLKREGLQVNPL
jgi:uncharacterized protein YbbK (DUF523 family)